jgi:hypothetical protein
MKNNHAPHKKSSSSLSPFESRVREMLEKDKMMCFLILKSSIRDSGKNRSQRIILNKKSSGKKKILPANKFLDDRKKTTL